MESTLLAIRSIGAEFANRIYLVIVLVALIVAVCVFGLNIWLTTYSHWWWLLLLVFMVPMSIAIGVLVVIKLVIRSVTPTQTKAQKVQTKAFVDKLQQVSDAVQTPKIVLMFRIVRDIAAPRSDGFVATLSHNTSTLTHDFVALSKTFKQ